MFLSRIEKSQPLLNAFITVTRERAIADARESERRIQKKTSRGLLDGIPIVLKDNIWTAGIKTTAGSKILGDFVPGQDATIAARLRRAGVVLLGKTNMHEFAYGVTTENPHFGAAHNPWDLKRSPGGSSGGSAAAVVAGLCVASIGTDTGGSIRIPAALCGAVGLKPSFGRVSCFGTVPLAPSFDHAGPIARTADDAAILLDAIAGRDPADVITLTQPAYRRAVNFRDLAAELRGRSKRRPLVLGWPREYFFTHVDPEIRAAIGAAARTFERLGARIEEVPLAHISEGDEPSTTIALAEATHVHRAAGWYPARAADYGEDVRKRIELGAEIRAVDFLTANDTCGAVRVDFDAVLTKVDAILAPTTPIAAPLIGEKLANIAGHEEPVRGALIRLNRPANLTGHPAISIPCGFTRAGLPIGLQIIGRTWDEGKLLAIAALFESARLQVPRRPQNF
jgi:aspartyl-tRNA(Asn)/glutamyl-tRNA(Gln) amidotransferase subunit A